MKSTSDFAVGKRYILWVFLHFTKFGVSIYYYYMGWLFEKEELDVMMVGRSEVDFYYQKAKILTRLRGCDIY